MTRLAKAAAVAAALLVATGCSSNTGKKDAEAGKGSAELTPTAVAQSYQEAFNARSDWKRVCEMQTERYRGGTVEECVAENAEKAESTAPSPSASESSRPPLRRADGSIVQPKPRPSASGPERAETGAVTASGSVAVPALGEHPAGTGVLVEYTVVWPTNTTTAKRALRLVQQGTQWLVDQAVEVAATDEAHGNPVHDALMRG
ncbi:hypothetical protein [Streptomyces subrutilus]|uniref:Lipoprotein n=1 Tax=Streptomyces subrutilus TaxID=36818 RepID=A0A1E5NXA5_9ACTN|nr:hypothetical protein [Streptomyces subrutilus]OEJ20881.1 hypothetical protein BGK67_35175 [Streptomyces subrutilus]